MKREDSVRALQTDTEWDVVVIGGGATGLGCAVDAAARGYRTVLVEQGDFAQGTSSRSTKLVHGGLRYLRAGNIALVRQALHERGLLLRNAPHLVEPLDFVIPTYALWEAASYSVGLKFYDLLAGKLGLGGSRRLSRGETLARLPTLSSRQIRGGILYRDAQFDDARLAISLAQTFATLGGTPLNYARVISLLHRNGVLRGVRVRDLESQNELEIPAHVVINATGVFCDAIRSLDQPTSAPMIAPSQGAHIVLERIFLPGSTALMIPRTDDGRVLFAIPWHDRVVVGTTDTPVAEPSLDPRPRADEVEFLLEHARRYLAKAPGPADILSAFAGLRPLVKQSTGKRTASLPRDHSIVISESGLVTITGGKWTTYRLMAEETVNAAARRAGLSFRACTTAPLALHEASRTSGPPLHPSLPYSAEDVLRGVRHEMARTITDLLARRTRALILDARASAQIAPQVAALMATELGRNEAWQEDQLRAFRALAGTYLP